MTVALKTLALAALIAWAPLAASAAPKPDPATASVTRILASKGFKAARASLDGGFDRIVSDTIALTEIPSPPFGEDKRAAAYLARLKAEPSLTDVERDAEGNVMGLRRGTGGGPLVVIAAHLDTVFPLETDVKVHRQGEELHAPGVGDDTASLAVLLGFIRAMDAAHLTTHADILFVGDVGEEGPGDLRGMRYLFGKGKYAGRIADFISLEPDDPGDVTNGGVGSIRYHVVFKGPGGHSLLDFGLVNPAYAMGGAMSRIGAIKVPQTPRTVFNVGVVGGGVSVNTIPNTLWMDVDMRSDDAAALKALDADLLAAISGAVDTENATRSTARGRITAEVQQIGARPVGHTDPAQPIVRLALAASAASGLAPRFNNGSSDANIPMSLGIPAITFPSGFIGKRFHSPEEFISVEKAPTLANLSTTLALLLSLAEMK